MTALRDSQLKGYLEALSALVYFQIDQPGYLRISGEDQQTFLQRQTTNDLKLLSSDNLLITVLTSPTGRILDILTIFQEEEQLGVLTLPGLRSKTIEFLRNRIFFMDKVSVEDASQDVAVIELLGPRIAELIRHFGFQKPFEKIDQVQSIIIDGIQIRYLSQSFSGQRLIIPRENVEDMLDAILDFGGTPLSSAAFEVLRVERGIPAAGHELVEKYTPLETGYQWAVSESKGCYTGQEVLARQITYDKITRQLVGLKLEEIKNPGDKLWSLEDGKQVGEITSSASSPNHGPIALGILKRPLDQEGTEVRVGNKIDGQIAKVTLLPF